MGYYGNGIDTVQKMQRLDRYVKNNALCVSDLSCHFFNVLKALITNPVIDKYDIVTIHCEICSLRDHISGHQINRDGYRHVLNQTQILVVSGCSECADEYFKYVKTFAKILDEHFINELYFIRDNPERERFCRKSFEYLLQAIRGSDIEKISFVDYRMTKLDEDFFYMLESLRDSQVVGVVISRPSRLFTSAMFELELNTAKRLNELISSISQSKKFYIQLTYVTEDEGLEPHGNYVTEDEGLEPHGNYVTEDEGLEPHCIYQHFDGKKVKFNIFQNPIGTAKSVNYFKTFQSTGIACLSFLEKKDFLEPAAQYCAEAFNETNINELVLTSRYFASNYIEHILHAFKHSHVAALTVHGITSWKQFPHIIRFVKEMKVIRLNILKSPVNVENPDCELLFGELLRDCGLIHVKFEDSPLETNGLNCLCEILADSSIVHLEFDSSSVFPKDILALAQHLPGSHVTRISLRDMYILRGANNGFLEVLGNTYLKQVRVDYHRFIFVFDRDLPPVEEHICTCELPGKTMSVADKICNMFKQLVVLDPISHEFVFYLSKNGELEKSDDKLNMQDFIFLLNALNGKQSAHIVDALCYDSKHNLFDLNMVKKVNDFISQSQNKFCEFFENNVSEFIACIGTSVSDYVRLVKEFERYELSVIAKNLLYHRELYFVDENGEILHPYIYKLMHKYGLPMYSELEPNKKENIISYFQNHDEIDEAQEIIHLLESICSLRLLN